MTVSDSTDQLLPVRLWRGLSERIVRSREGAGMMLVAGRSFAADLATPASSHEKLMAEHARTFRFATRFLPGHYRDATIRLYAFFRSLDDLVDESPDDAGSKDSIRAELAEWEQWFGRNQAASPPRPDLGMALEPVISTYQIPSYLFLDFLEGLKADVDPVTPTNRADVEHYSYQVASTVGIAMAYVFGSTTPAAIEAARKLGIAMQLTNILRDVGGDAARSRVYLPVSLLSEHDLTADDVFAQWQGGNGPDRRLVRVLQVMSGWADECYAAGIDGIRLLPRDVQMPILVAARLYQQILQQLDANEYDSLRQRASTTYWKKLDEARRCMFSLNQCLDDANSHPSNLTTPLDRDTRRARSNTYAN